MNEALRLPQPPSPEAGSPQPKGSPLPRAALFLSSLIAYLPLVLLPGRCGERLLLSRFLSISTHANVLKIVLMYNFQDF